MNVQVYILTFTHSLILTKSHFQSPPSIDEHGTTLPTPIKAKMKEGGKNRKEKEKGKEGGSSL